MALASGLPSVGQYNKLHIQLALSCRQKHFYTHSQEVSDVHTPTHSSTHTAIQTRTHTAEAGDGGVGCVTVGSSGHTHPPDLSNCQGCQPRAAEAGGGAIGQATFIMSADLNIWHMRSLVFSTFLFSSFRGRIGYSCRYTVTQGNILCRNSSNDRGESYHFM